MDTTNRTIDELDYIRRLIADLNNAYDFDDSMDILIRLRNTVNDAATDKVISEQMYNEFAEVFNNNGRGLGLNTEELAQIADKWLYYVGDADDRMSKSVEFNAGLFDSDMHKDDSKDVLAQIMEALDKYVAAYSETNGALNAVDEFCVIGEIIKDAVDKDKLTNKTASALMEPLTQMKNNMFNPTIQNDAYDEFKRIIDEGLALEDEKGPQEQSKEQQNDENILSSAGTVLERAVDGVVKGLNKINKVIDERAQKVAGEYEKSQQASDANPEQELAKQQRAQDVTQKPEDLIKREELAKKEKNKPKTEEEALLQLRDAINQYRAVKNDKSASYAKLREVREAYNDAIDNPLLHEFKRDFYTKHATRSSDVDMVAYNQAKMLEIIDKELGQKSNQVEQAQQTQQIRTPDIALHGADLSKKQEENKDAAQKTEDLIKREDTVQNKKSNDGAKEQTQEQQLAELTKLVSKYEKIYQEKGSMLDEGVGDVWQELTEGINKVVKNKLISDDLGNQLIDTHEFLRRNLLNSEKQFEGIDKFKQILDAQSQEKHSGDEKNKFQETPRRPDLGKNQRAEDVQTQKPEDLIKREDKTNGQVKADEKTQEDYESLINGLEDVLAHHKDRDPDSFRRMMFAIKDLSQQGLLSEEMKQEYMDVFNRVKEFSNQPSSHEHGATQLSQTIINHLDTLEAKRTQKEPENKDVAQKPEDVMHRDEKSRDEFFARMAKNYKGAKNNDNEKQQRAQDIAQKPEDLMKREEENRRKQENFEKGNAQVQKMDDKRDEQRKTLSQQALAAYRRKMLEGRGTPNV